MAFKARAADYIKGTGVTHFSPIACSLFPGFISFDSVYLSDLPKNTEKSPLNQGQRRPVKYGLAAAQCLFCR